jgi:hypothetical protein
MYGGLRSTVEPRLAVETFETHERDIAHGVGAAKPTP